MREGERIKAHMTQVARVDLFVCEDCDIGNFFGVLNSAHQKNYVPSIRHIIHVFRRPCLQVKSYR